MNKTTVLHKTDLIERAIYSEICRHDGIRAKYIRIYADVLVITENKVFSLAFKMKDRIDPEEILQAAKYTEYLEVLFGPAYDVIPALVLTRATDLYRYEPLGNRTRCSRCAPETCCLIFLTSTWDFCRNRKSRQMYT